jgi:hypothetical protein
MLKDLVEIQEKVEAFLNKRDGHDTKAMSIKDIKRKIRLFCRARDINEQYNNARATPRDQYCEYRPFVIREGVQIMRDKIK